MKKLIAWKMKNGRKEDVVVFNNYSKEDKPIAIKFLREMGIEYDGIDSVAYSFKR